MAERGADVAVIVQARSSSRRLPGKVLEPLAGRPSIARMLERVARMRTPADLVVATSDRADDDALASVVGELGVRVVRGPLDDVLARFVRALPDGAETVVRLTGDCPLIDPEIVDHCIALHRAHRARDPYVSNAAIRTQPDGLDVEVVSRRRLIEADRQATDPADREHVLPHVRRTAPWIAVGQRVDLSDLRWTLDTPADYRSLRALFEALGVDERGTAFTTRDVYALLVERPELIHLADTTDASAGRDDERRADAVARIRNHLAAPAITHEITRETVS